MAKNTPAVVKDEVPLPAPDAPTNGAVDEAPPTDGAVEPEKKFTFPISTYNRYCTACPARCYIGTYARTGEDDVMNVELTYTEAMAAGVPSACPIIMNG